MADKLGGGVATAVSLRSSPVASSGSPAKSTTSILVEGVNNLVQQFAKVKVQNDAIRNEEDRIRAVSTAEADHYDSNNAMLGGSQDNNLNKEVESWRNSGLMDSEIRVKIKDYKINKGITALGLDANNKADNVSMAYFDTYNKLELKALTPVLAEDRKEIQSKISNMTSSYIRVSDDSLQDKYNNTLTTNKSYGMGEKETVANVMQSAFDLARRGDESLLKDLPNLQTSTGEKVIDTIDGSEMFNKLTANLATKKEHDDVLAKKELEFNQEATATKLYTQMIGNKDIHAFKLGIDDALSSGSISMQQHNSLNTYYKTVTNVDAFPKNSDRSTYIKAYSKAEQGTLTTDELMVIQSKLSNSDFEFISRKAIEKGGINGVGSEESKFLNERIKDDTASFSGSSGLNDLTLTFTDKTIFSKRAGYIQQNLSSDVDKFISNNKRLPNEDEYSKLRDKVVSNSKDIYNAQTVKAPDTKVETTKKSSDNINGRGELLNHIKTLKSKQEVDAWMNTLTTTQIKLLKGE